MRSVKSDLPKISVIAVVGPTASGKSAAGIALARELSGEIICADSRTVYRSMDIGTAKVTGEAREGGIISEGVMHWGLDLADPDERFSMVQFRDYADAKIVEIINRGKLPILVGGTGLYVRAVLEQLSAPIVADPALRASLEARGLDDLVNELRRVDLLSAEQIDLKNKRRVVRALEVALTTGKSFWEQRQRKIPRYEARQIGIEVEREELYRRIDHRVRDMVKQGLENEVRALAERFGWDAPGMEAIGYREWREYFAGSKSLDEVVAQIQLNTRHYAKRQMTWWRRDEEIRWGGAAGEVVGVIPHPDPLLH